MNRCDKCYQLVPKENDAFALKALIDDHKPMHLTIGRHLLPVTEGEVLCEGSPSLAQYLPGQPRDTRPHYAYKTKYEAGVRRAYQELQEMYTPH